MATTPAEDLFPNVRNPEGTLVINDRCLIKSQHNHCVVIVCGVVVAQYQSEDSMAEGYAIVNLVEQGWADQNDVAQAFLRSVRNVRRYQERCAEGGLAGLPPWRQAALGKAFLIATHGAHGAKKCLSHIVLVRPSLLDEVHDSVGFSH